MTTGYKGSKVLTRPTEENGMYLAILFGRKVRRRVVIIVGVAGFVALAILSGTFSGAGLRTSSLAKSSPGHSDISKLTSPQWPLAKQTNASLPTWLYLPGNGGGKLNYYASKYMTDVYGGLVATDGASHFEVFMTALDGGQESTLLRATSVPASKVTFVLTPTTLAQQLELQKQVNAAMGVIQAEGIHLVGNGPDIQTGKLQLRVANPTPAQISYLTQSFGPYVEVVSSQADTILS